MISNMKPRDTERCIRIYFSRFLELSMKSWLWHQLLDKSPTFVAANKGSFFISSLGILPVEHPAGKHRAAASDVAGPFCAARCFLGAAGDAGLHVPHPTPGEQPWSSLQWQSGIQNSQDSRDAAGHPARLFHPGSPEWRNRSASLHWYLNN